MAHRLYMDVNIPGQITASLRNRGIDVLTSQDDGTRKESDAFLLNRATSLARILVTQDKDFLRIGRVWQSSGRKFSGIIFAPRELSIGMAVADLELLVTCTEASELENCVTYLPLR